MSYKSKQDLVVPETELSVNADKMMEGVRMGARQQAAVASPKATTQRMNVPPLCPLTEKMREVS